MGTSWHDPLGLVNLAPRKPRFSILTHLKPSRAGISQRPVFRKPDARWTVSSEHEDELNWMAFCYIAGELPPEAASAFERRLADDQLARDAVCEAIALAERLLVAAPSTNHLVPPVSTTGTAFEHDTS